MGMYEFSSDDAFRFARGLGIPVRQRGYELFFQECPYCHGRGKGNEKSFSINLETGQFKCLRASCGISGNMVTLSRDFEWFSLGNEADEYYRPKRQYRKFKTRKEPIVPKEPAIRYLEGRGISESVARKYEITTQTQHDNILVFPFYDDRGDLQFVKYRKTDFDRERDNNKEWCERDCKPILFGMKQCDGSFDRLVITEGQIDSLSGRIAGTEDLGGRMNYAEADIDELQRHTQALEENDGYLEQRLGSAESDIAQLQERISGAEADIDELQQRTQTLEESMKDLTEEGGALERLAGVEKAQQEISSVIQTGEDGSTTIGKEGTPLYLVGEIYINGVLFEQGETT